MWLEALITLIVVSLISLAVYGYSKPSQKLYSTYTKPGWRVAYWVRVAWWSVVVWHHQSLRNRRLNNFSPASTDSRYCGIAPTPEEEALEEPVTLTTDRHEDGVVMWGGDGAGRVVVARVVRLAERRACVALVVRDADGSIYTLPNQPDSTVSHCDESTWRGAGLLLECVQPMRTWRLKFCGLLRKGVREHYSTESSPSDDEGVLEARLDMVWRAVRAPVDIFEDSSPLLLAQALAREPEADLRYFTSLDRDAYDQPGVLAGAVQLGLIPGSGPSPDPPTWYLRGSRQRRWGMSEAATNLHRSVDLISYMNNGDLLYVNTFCYPASLTHCTFGYLQTSKGDLLPMTSSSFDMARTGEDGSLPSHILFSCKAGRRELKVCMTLNKGSLTYYSGDPWTLKHDLSFTDTFVEQDKGYGVAVFTRRYDGLCPVPEHHEVLLEAPPDSEDEEVDGPAVPLVADISDSRCRAVELAGGKGASLAKLSGLLREQCPEQFTVPTGIIVTTAAWDQQVQAHSSLRAALLNVEKAAASGRDSQIKEACDKASEAFTRITVCEEVRQAVTGALQELYDDNDPPLRFAVRSSGCDEDGSEASAAGQNLTVLGCRGTTEVLAALPRCWASLLQYNSVHYRRQHGLSPVGQMALVVQEMVAAEVAGVIFTRQPATGSPAVVTITANYGLGESVVSGSSEPDTVVVRRSWRDELSLASSTVGDKATQQVLAVDGGTTEETVSSEARGCCCVGERLALRLARLAVHLEKAFRGPQDIEFAVVKERIFLLQARPVTALNAWSDLELQLELDSPLMTDGELLTRANTGEVFPGPCTPLTISLVNKALDLALQRVRNLPLLDESSIDASSEKCIAISSLHCMINMVEVLYMKTERPVQLTHKAVDLAVIGHEVTTEHFLAKAEQRSGGLPFYFPLVQMLYALTGVLLNKRRVTLAKDRFQDYNIKMSRATRAQALYTEISRRLPDIIEMCLLHGQVGSVSSMTQVVAFMMLAEGSSDISESHIADVATLLSSCCEEQDSAAVPTALTTLAKVIGEDEECSEFLGLPAEEGGVWLRTHPGPVGETFQRFLDQHGHRCIKEFELQSLSWGMDSRSLVSTLQRMVAMPSALTRAKKADTTDDILKNIKTNIKANTRRALQVTLPVCRSSVMRRETTKSCLIKIVDSFRRAYRQLGGQLVWEGRLPESELIFFLQHHEIGALLQKRSPALIAKAVRRRRLVAKLENLQFPEISEGRPEPITPQTLLPAGAQCGGRQEIIKGTPVCLGKVVGPARVVTDLQQSAAIKAGDILVTYSTDVGWTPYFPLLAGVITEIGGLISHGAVVAREYGLPCVVGTRGVTQLLQSGDLIELDGNTGAVTRLATA